MKKRFYIPILVFVLSLFFVSATDFPSIYMEFGDSVVVNGKNVSFVTFGSAGNFVFEVDGVRNIVQSGNTLNGVTIIVGTTFISAAIVNLTVNFVCGNGECGRNENSEVCCADCNCSKGFICVSNICKKPECSIDIDCDDNNSCSVNKCENRFCTHASISDCISGDGCCPTNCTSEVDNDCELVDECSSRLDCDDLNPCTLDNCSGVPKKCSHVRVDGCVWNESCVSFGTVKEESYCSSNGWVDQKMDGVGCSKDYECLNQNCIGNVCGSNQKVSSGGIGGWRGWFSSGKKMGPVSVGEEELSEKYVTIRNLIIINVVILLLIFFAFYFYHARKVKEEEV